MSLSTDRFFYDALRNDSDIIATTGGRIFNPGREDIDEEEDKIPYIILSLDGVQNEHADNKDECGEGLVDSDTISVLVVAENRNKLANLANTVRNVLHQALDEFWDEDVELYGFSIFDYSFSAGPVQLDASKPCCFQTLTYVVDNEIEFKKR